MNIWSGSSLVLIPPTSYTSLVAPRVIILYFTPGDIKVHSFSPTWRISGSCSQINPENVRFLYLTQTIEHQVHSFNPTWRISGLCIQTNLEYSRVIYSIILENVRFIYTTQPGEYKVYLFKPTRRTWGSFAQTNLENIRSIDSTQPGISFNPTGG